MVRRYVSFALNDMISILYLFTFLFVSIGGFKGLGSERAKHYGVLAFSSPPNMWNYYVATCLVYI